MSESEKDYYQIAVEERIGYFQASHLLEENSKAIVEITKIFVRSNFIKVH